MLLVCWDIPLEALQHRHIFGGGLIRRHGEEARDRKLELKSNFDCASWKVQKKVSYHLGVSCSLRTMAEPGTHSRRTLSYAKETVEKRKPRRNRKVIDS